MNRKYHLVLKHLCGPRLTGVTTFALTCVVMGLALVCFAQDGEPAAPEPGEIIVGNLVYAQGKSAVCFSDQFVSEYGFRTGQNVRENMQDIDLGDEAIFDYPFIVMAGEQAFELGDEEKTNLKAYLDRGGFVLASAGCSSRAWALSFTEVIEELYGDDALTALEMDHPIFHTLYEIAHVEVRRPSTRDAIYAMQIEGQVRLIFSPIGLNDTANAGGGCCCCGGNEIRNAKYINANILAYALTH